MRLNLKSFANLPKTTTEAGWLTICRPVSKSFSEQKKRPLSRPKFTLFSRKLYSPFVAIVSLNHI